MFEIFRYFKQCRIKVVGVVAVVVTITAVIITITVVAATATATLDRRSVN